MNPTIGSWRVSWMLLFLDGMLFHDFAPLPFCRDPLRTVALGTWGLTTDLGRDFVGKL